MKPQLTPEARNWREIVPPGWTGTCVVCNKTLTEADWAVEQIVAIRDPRFTVCCHASHVVEDRRAATRALANAVMEQLKARGVTITKGALP